MQFANGLLFSDSCGLYSLHFARPDRVETERTHAAFAGSGFPEGSRTAQFPGSGSGLGMAVVAFPCKTGLNVGAHIHPSLHFTKTLVLISNPRDKPPGIGLTSQSSIGRFGVRLTKRLDGSLIMAEWNAISWHLRAMPFSMALASNIYHFRVCL